MEYRPDRIPANDLGGAVRDVVQSVVMILAVAQRDRLVVSARAYALCVFGETVVAQPVSPAVVEEIALSPLLEDVELFVLRTELCIEVPPV